MATHQIPDPEKFIDGLYDDAFVDFVQKRATHMYQLVERHVLLQSDVIQGVQEFPLRPSLADKQRITNTNKTPVRRKVSGTRIINRTGHTIGDGAIIDPKKEDPTWQKIRGFEFMGSFYEADTWRDLLLKLCCALIDKHGKEEFTKKTSNFYGRKGGFYITNDRSKLRQAKPIPGTNLWLEVNHSAMAVNSVIDKLLDLFGYDRSSLEIYRDR